MLGPLAEGNKGSRWTLLETGSWATPSAWHSMCGAKRLVCEPSAGKEEIADNRAAAAARMWVEMHGDARLGDMEEKRRELYCYVQLPRTQGQERVCVYRLNDQQVQRAVCGSQLRCLQVKVCTLTFPPPPPPLTLPFASPHPLTVSYLTPTLPYPYLTLPLPYLAPALPSPHLTLTVPYRTLPSTCRPLQCSKGCAGSPLRPVHGSCGSTSVTLGCRRKPMGTGKSC